MPFKIVRNDITQMKVDAIVNSANPHAIVGGGVDYAINIVSGPKLLEARKTIGDIPTGAAYITPAFNLHAKYVIHTVGPVWHGGSYNEVQLVTDCYSNCLKLAFENKCKSIAFPLISAGIFGFPVAKSLQIARTVVSEFLYTHEMDVILVIFARTFNSLSDELVSSIYKYMEDTLEESNLIENNSINYFHERMLEPSYNSSRSLDTLMDELDETFSESLMRLIKDKGKTEVEVYKKANIDRKLFSKIRSNNDYQPSKVTALSFAIALELNLDETEDLLERAGFAISHSSQFDIVIQYCIENLIYDVFEINEILFNFRLPLLVV